MVGLNVALCVLVAPVARVRTHVRRVARLTRRRLLFRPVVGRDGVVGQRELRRRPGRPCVAGSAFRALGSEGVGVEAGLGMAGDASRGRTLEDPILVTLVTLDFGVRAGQGEVGLRMVELRVRPAVRVVALAALLPEYAFMLVVLGVAGIAVLWGFLQRFYRRGLGVTLGARHRSVLPGQLEGQFVVVEVGAVTVHTVVAGDALLTESGDVLRHEIRLEIGVTFCACRIVEVAEVLRMTLAAADFGSFGGASVPAQRIAACLVVRERGEVKDGEGGPGALVFGVAAAATGAGAPSQQPTVEPGVVA